MRTLILDGSPHLHGNTAFLIQQWQTRMPGEYVVVSAYHQKVEPCTDCRYCLTQEGCVKKDSMDDVYHQWYQSDRIVIASPIYFTQLTGPLLNMVSRFQSIWAANKFLKKGSFSKKQGIIILTGGGEGSADPALAGARAILSVLNATVEGEILSLHTDTIPAWEDPSALEQMDICVQQLLQKEKE